MQTLSRIIRLIDKGYDDGAATSNYVMGVTVSIAGLVALSADNPAIRGSALAFAILVVALFGWRMVASFRRPADIRKRRKR